MIVFLSFFFILFIDLYNFPKEKKKQTHELT